MGIINSILVLADLSESSKNTLLSAASMASKFDASLTIYHAAPNSSEQQLQKLDAEFNELFEQTLSHCDCEIQSYRTMVANEDFPNGKLLNQLITDADLVVMGSRVVAGRPSNRNRIQHMVETLVPPVLVVPEDRGIGQMQHIMYCSSYEELTSDHPLSIVKNIASQFNSEVRLAHVKTASGNPKRDHVERSREEGSYFEPEVKFSYKLIRSGDVIDGIQHYIKKKGDNDLLVMVKRNHQVLGRIFGKKYTFKMLHQATIPMLIIKEPQLN